MLRVCRLHVRVAPGGPDVIRKEAWPFYRTISGVRLCWELEEPKGPEGGASRAKSITYPYSRALFNVTALHSIISAQRLLPLASSSGKAAASHVAYGVLPPRL